MGFLNTQLLVSLLRNKIVLVSAGALAAGGIATPAILSAQKSAPLEPALPSEELDVEFSSEKLKKLLDESNLFQQRRIVDREGNRSLPSEEDILFFQDTLKVINVKNPDYLNGKLKKLSEKQKQVLQDFFDLYAELESSKSISIPPEGAQREHIPSYFNSISAATSLREINWTSGSIKLVKNEDSKENNWGWSNWAINPFSYFYDKKEDSWKEKMSKWEKSSTYYKSEVAKEIEYDIALWLLKDMMRIQKKYLNH